MTRNPSAELPCKSSGRRLITDVGQSWYVPHCYYHPLAALTRRPGNVLHSAKTITYGGSEWTRVECSTDPRRRFFALPRSCSARGRAAGRLRTDDGCAVYRTRLGLCTIKLLALGFLALDVQTSNDSHNPPHKHLEGQQLTAMNQPLGPRRPVVMTSTRAEELPWVVMSWALSVVKPVKMENSHKPVLANWLLWPKFTPCSYRGFS